MAGSSTYLHVSANTTIKPIGNAGVATGTAGLGPDIILVRVNINTAGASGNVLTLYDGSATTDPVIAVIDTTRSGVDSIEFDVICNKGLSYVLATGTAADLTIVYR